MLFRFLFAIALLFSADFALADDPPKKDPPAQTDAEKLAAALTRQKELEEENERLKAKGKKKKAKADDDDGENSDDDDDEDDDDEEDDLRGKARKARKAEEKNAASTKQIERAVSFVMGVDDFIVKNAALLPNEIVQIVKLGHKETYDSQIAKANALKAAIVQAYFGVQSNVDMLTNSQKTALDDYLKLTKTGKETKAADVYENIFEPTLEMTRRIKKAEEVSRGNRGFATSTESNSAYKDRLVQGARKTHLGEKEA